MKWKEFCKIAYPEKWVIRDSRRPFFARANRWLGLYIAYPLYFLKVSANFITLSRMVISIVAFYLLFLATKGAQWLPLIGAFLLIGQHILDSTDGALARLSGKTSKLGDRLDALTNNFARGAVLVLMGFLTKNIFAVIISVFSLFILINFREEMGVDFSNNTTVIRIIKMLYRVVLSVQFMLFTIPILFALINIFWGGVMVFAYTIVVFYATLAVFWIILCLLFKNQ